MTTNRHTLTAAARNAALGQLRDHTSATDALLRVLNHDASTRLDALQDVSPTDAATIGRLQGELCYIRDMVAALGGAR